MIEKPKRSWKKILLISLVLSCILVMAIYGLFHGLQSEVGHTSETGPIQTPSPTPPRPPGPTPTPSGTISPEPGNNPPGFERQVLGIGIADYFANFGYTGIFEGDNFSCWERPVMLYQLVGENDMLIHYDEDNFNESRVWISVSLASFDAQKRNFTGRIAVDPCSYPGALGSVISETDERYYKEIDNTFETVDAYVEFLSKKGIVVKKYYKEKK